MAGNKSEKRKGSRDGGVVFDTKRKAGCREPALGMSPARKAERSLDLNSLCMSVIV